MRPSIVLAGIVLMIASANPARARELSLSDRVAAQRAIEQVYWKHRIWPKDNPGPKPALSSVLPEAALTARVQDALTMSTLLDTVWHRPITGTALQRELDRMVRETKAPATLRELFEALHDDPFIIAECLARPALAGRQMEPLFVAGALPHPAAPLDTRAIPPPEQGYSVPTIALGGCTDDTWMPTAGSAVPDTWFNHTAVWTGSEMIVWGSTNQGRNSGGRYDPATDSWAMCSLTTGSGANVPTPRPTHVAIWTGTEMIVWGGSNVVSSDIGGRYNPTTDTWAASSLTTGSGANVPNGILQTAVWTGSEMIVWGLAAGAETNSGGRYDPSTDTWAACSLTHGTGANVPAPRNGHTAVWTGSEMIVWGGGVVGGLTNTGGRYDPVSDSWAATSLTNAPETRTGHTAVWTGSEMIVWGGVDSHDLGTGGRYDPAADSWLPSSLDSGSGLNVPDPGRRHTALWTGSEMIVWGGDSVGGLNTGGRYDPATDSWASCSLTTGSGANVPAGRYGHTAAWTGSEMIIWGGSSGPNGGRYDPATDSWATTSLMLGTSANAATARTAQASVWTGAELLVWGGSDRFELLQSGGRYDPATNSWVASSLTTGAGANVPSPRANPTAVWTGAEMIVWGGEDGGPLATGGRYNPTSDLWIASSLNSGLGVNAPAARSAHTAVWTGANMIVWGGYNNSGNTRTVLRTGGRFDPATDAWLPTTLLTGTSIGTPPARQNATAVWTGSEMIVWGGNDPITLVKTGGRFNPVTDSWAVTILIDGIGANVPSARYGHTAVWTGTEMIIWGGAGDGAYLYTGGRYDPSTDTWATSSLTFGSGPGVPAPRGTHSAVWTGAEMIVWGGFGAPYLQTGGRYSPFTDSWTPSSLSGGTGAGTPVARELHSAVWTGSQMIVWGGNPITNNGGLYCAVCTPSTWYQDFDGDGHGVASLTQTSCTRPPNYVLLGDDCDDSDPSAYAGATEVCDGVDDDCDTIVDNSGDALCDDANACSANTCHAAGGCAASDVDMDATGFSDGRVDGRDLTVLATAWNSCPGDPLYNTAANLDKDAQLPGACVDSTDFHLFMNAFGRTCP